MAKPSYQVITLDLAVARDHARVVEVGTKFDGVAVHQLPGGATVSLAFGANSPDIPLLRVEPFRFLDGCEHPFFCDEGLFVTNTAGAGTLILIVSQGTSPNVQQVGV